MAPSGPPSDPPNRPGRKRDRKIADWDWGDDDWDAPASGDKARRGADRPASAADARRDDPSRPDDAPRKGPERWVPSGAGSDRDGPSADSAARPGSAPRGGSGRSPGSTADVVRRRRLVAGGGGLVLLILFVLVVSALASGGGGGGKRSKAPVADRRLLSGQLALASTAAVDQLDRMSAVERYAKLGMPVYCGAGRKPWVALTFDDGPGELSPKFIALLSKEKVPATMFRIGRNVPGREEYVRVQRNLGWDSGSHTMTHPPLATLSEKDQRAEIDGGNRASQRALGRAPELFRPPYESHNATTDKIIKDNGQVEVLWNVDTQDSLGATSTDSIVQTAIKGLHPGSIILMHEVKANTFAALPRIIAELRKRKLEPVTVSKMLAGDGPSVDQLRKGFSGCEVNLTPGKAAS